MPDTFIPPPALSTVKFLLVIFAVQAMLLYAVHRTSADRAVARRRVLYTAAFFVLVMVGSAGLAESGFLAADPIRAVVFAAVTNLLALALAFTKPGATWLGITAHVVGLALLANVGRIAVTSLPTSFRAFEGAPLLLPFHAPYIWILPFAVAAALFGHVVGLRAILTRPTLRRPRPRS